jgi:hypothetical protein
LVGQLSNPSPPLVAVLEAATGVVRWRPAALQRPIAVEPASRRLGNGVVKRAIIKVLAAADEAMPSVDVHQAVEHLLGHPVSKNSVSWCLAADVRGRQPRFERISYGVYRLKRR